MRLALWLVGLLVAGGACGDDSGSVPDAPAGADAAIDAPVDGTTVDAQPLAGTTAITARYVAQAAHRAYPGAPIPDAFARIENATGEFLEAMTDADGSVTFMVDAAKGPFDITFAKFDHQPISVLDITESPGDLQTFPLLQPLTTDVQGTISGKTLATNRVTIDMLGAATIQRTAATYVLHATGSSIPSPVVGVEVDATGTPVNIVASPPRLYDAPNTTVDLTFTSPAPAVTTTTFTVALPVTGVITAEVTRNVTQSSQFSQAYVIKSYDDLPLEVGTGRIADLVGSTTNVTIKHFEGDFAPTAALVDFDNGDGDPFYGTGGYFPVTQGATATIPTVDALEMTGTTLDDLAGTTAGAGWEHTWFLIYGENSEWRVYPSAATVTNRRLPHLPSGYSQTVFGELTGAAAWLIKNGSTDPLWRRDHVVAWTYAFWYRDL